MDSIAYKLSEAERKDLISCCSIKGSSTYKLEGISPLPWGYLFCFGEKSGCGSAFVVNIHEKNKSKEIRVLPECGFGDRLKEFLTDYFKNQK